MNKKILVILLLLVAPSVMAAMRICDSPIEPSEIPCMVVSTYNFGICTNFEVMIFDETPTLLDTITYDDYGITGRCNMTFNYTERGSYTLNSSDGSSATIIVEGVKMDFLRLMVFSLFFALGMVFIVLMHKFKEDEVSIVYGFFSSAIFTLLGAIGFFGFEFINLDGVTLPFNLNGTLSLIAIIIAVYAAWISTTMVKKHRTPKYDENGERFEE